LRYALYLVDDIRVRVDGNRDAIRQMEYMAKLRYLAAPAEPALPIIPGRVVIADDFGRGRKRGKALEEPRAPESVVVGRLRLVLDQGKSFLE